MAKYFGVEPLDPESEAIISKLVNGLVAKPGFIDTEATRDLLTRAMRIAVTKIIEADMRRALAGK